MKSQIADVREKVSGEPAVKATAYLGGSTGPLDLVGAGLTTELLAAAGAENPFASEQPYFQASLASVAAKLVEAGNVGRPNIRAHGALRDIQQASQRRSRIDHAAVVAPHFAVTVRGEGGIQLRRDVAQMQRGHAPR